MLQHKSWVGTGDVAEPRRAMHVGGQELEQWRSTPIGRLGMLAEWRLGVGMSSRG